MNLFNYGFVMNAPDICFQWEYFYLEYSTLVVQCMLLIFELCNYNVEISRIFVHNYVSLVLLLLLSFFIGIKQLFFKFEIQQVLKLIQQVIQK